VPPVTIVPPEEVPVLHFGTAEKGAEKIAGVRLVAVDPDGFVYAGDTDAGSVLRYASEGKPAGRFDIAEPKGPWTGLAADRAGVVYVASAGRLFRYDGASGKLLGEVKHPDGAGFFHVAPRPDAGVIASWRNAQRDDFVLVAKDGTVETIHRNAVAGASGEPAGDVLVAMDGRRTIYAAVNPLHAICIFKFTGEYVNRFGSEGDEDGQFSGAIAGLTADGQGQIFVTDAKGVSVIKSVDGGFVRRLEVKGTGIAIDDDDALFTAAGTEVAKYQIPPPPKED
jgi:outer membrane protein assembly factor BamB